MNILYIIKDLFDCDFNLQLWINHRYKDPKTAYLPNASFDHIVTKDGLKFGLGCLFETDNVLVEYRFDDITSEDIVLDVGANVGGFSIRAAKKAGHVFAVEPLWTKELEQNIIRNNLQDKITVLPFAIGDGNNMELEYNGKTKTVQTKTLTDIRKMIGPITFLKIDIEGGEWGINPHEFDGIRRIEFETHTWRKCYFWNIQNSKILLDYLRKNWDITVESKANPRHGSYIHACAKGEP